jgi:hypothetical protein
MSKLLRKKKRKLNPFTALSFVSKLVKSKNKKSTEGDTELNELDSTK